MIYISIVCFLGMIAFPFLSAYDTHQITILLSVDLSIVFKFLGRFEYNLSRIQLKRGGQGEGRQGERGGRKNRMGRRKEKRDKKGDKNVY